MDQEKRWIRLILRRGSREAADQLIRAYYDEIFRYACRQMGNREAASDLTQDIFMAALRALPSYQEKKAGFRTWLYRIATHKVIDAKRRAGPAMLPLEETEPADPVDFAAQVSNRVLLDQIEGYISKLDPQIQEVYRLRLYGEWSFPAIAALVGRPEAGVKAQYYRLMARLRKEFAVNESME